MTTTSQTTREQLVAALDAADARRALRQRQRRGYCLVSAS